MARYGILILVAVLASACSYTEEKGSATPALPRGRITESQLTFEGVRSQIFVPNCISCHGDSGGVNLETYDAAKREIDRIQSAALIEKSMPPSGPLSQADQDLLAAWIQAGAPEGATGGTGPGPSPSPSPVPSVSPSPEPQVPLEPTFASIRRMVLEPRCLTCHVHGGDNPKVPLGTLDQILHSPRELVLPGDPDESGLVIAISRADAKRMPPPSTGKPPLSEQEITVIRQWITKGAPQ